MTKAERSAQRGKLQQLFDNAGLKRNENTARLIKAYAEDDPKRIARLIQAWLKEDEKKARP
ncbi:hypothetical protein [Lacimicrobium sp. SS2-24]|uniref:hypothetical protein n=1 Tax=Lacimicrobium sp. SS2-24 TaxID=2005569 RepID=UPI000B4B6788|nr:hypothetical protein [Lacimicrobium sp. SS2-24]